MKKIVYGFHAVKMLIKQHPERIVAVQYVGSSSYQKLKSALEALEKQGVKLQLVEASVLDEHTQGARHQGVLAICREVIEHHLTLESLLAESENPALLVLDGVQDPHNLGACIRTACAAGFDAVIIPKDGSVPVNATVRKVASGAADMLPVITVTNVARALETLKTHGVWIYGAAEGGSDDLYAGDYTMPTAFVLGNEGKGLRSNTQKHCDGLIHIPCSAEFSTLNVSVASAVCVFELVRQRRA